MPSFLVYTDIDGTFVDAGYSYRGALPTLKLIKEKKIPLVFCTSKTRAEIEVYRKELGIKDPFISENGGAVYIPRGYFGRLVSGKLIGDYEVIQLGTPYEELREALDEIRGSAGCRITGFGDMSIEEVSRDSGLDLKAAEMAKRREYDEPFRIYGSEGDVKRILGLIKRRNLNYTRGGRYYHILGGNDKGKAVRILTEIYRKENPEIKTIGLGDSENDIPMLENVDVPVLIRKSDNSFAEFKDAVKSTLAGPDGWSEVLLEILL